MPPLLKSYLAVMFGGAIGTGLRMWLSAWLAAKYGETFPVGTLVVNVTGCFVIGFFASITGPDGMFLTAPIWRQIVMIGVLGGYTTFSSFSLQTLNLAATGEWGRAGLNIFLSVVLCLLAVWLGNVAAAALNQR
jgi:CrcB protein